jgi:hypothetical protein
MLYWIVAIVPVKKSYIFAPNENNKHNYDYY